MPRNKHWKCAVKGANLRLLFKMGTADPHQGMNGWQGIPHMNQVINNNCQLAFPMKGIFMQIFIRLLLNSPLNKQWMEHNVKTTETWMSSSSHHCNNRNSSSNNLTMPIWVRLFSPLFLIKHKLIFILILQKKYLKKNRRIYLLLMAFLTWKNMKRTPTTWWILCSKAWRWWIWEVDLPTCRQLHLTYLLFPCILTWTYLKDEDMFEFKFWAPQESWKIIRSFKFSIAVGLCVSNFTTRTSSLTPQLFCKQTLSHKSVMQR